MYLLLVYPCVVAISRAVDASFVLRVALIAIAIVLSIRQILWIDGGARPMVWFIGSWNIAFSLYCSGVVMMPQRAADGYPLFYLVAGCLLTVAVGGLWDALEVRRTSSSEIISLNGTGRWCDLLTLTPFRNRVINVASVCGVIAALLFAVEMVMINGVNILDPARTREIFAARETTILGQAAALLFWGSFVSIAGLLLYGERVGVWTKSTWLLGGVSGAASSVFAAGRATMAELCVAAIVLAAIKNKANRRETALWRRRMILGTIALLVLVYSLAVGTSRGEIAYGRSKADMLLRLSGATVDSEALRELDGTPKVLIDTFIEMYMYSAAPISNCEGILGGSLPDPTYGLYIAPFLTRRLMLFFPGIKSPVERLRELADVAQAEGIFGHGWITTNGMFVLEYGRVGGLIACCIFGIALAAAHSKFKKQPSLGTALVVVCACVCGAFGPMVFMLTDTTILLIGVIGSVIAVIERLTRRKTERDRVRRFESVRSAI